MNTGHGLGGKEVRRYYPELFAAGKVGHQADVAGQQLHGGEAVRVHIIGRSIGILCILPAVFAPVIEVVPVVVFLDVPFFFIGLVGLAVRGGGAAEGRLSAVQALIHPEAQTDAVDGSGLLLEQAAQIDAMRIPLVQVQVRVQGNVAPVHQAAAATQGTFFAQIIILEEAEDVLFVNLHHAYFHGRKVHGAEGEDQLLLVRQDIALEGNLHGGLLFLLLPAAGEGLVQGRSALALQAFVQGQGHFIPAAFEMHVHHGVLHLHIATGDAREFHQAFHVGIGRCIVEGDFHAVVPKDRLHHPERFTVVGLFRIFGRCCRLPLDGNAEGELLRGIRHHFSQFEAYLIGLAHLQGSFFRDEGHGLGIVPLYLAFHGRLETEQIFGHGR